MFSSLASIIEALKSLIQIVATVVTTVELVMGAGNGPEKEAEAVAQIKALIPAGVLPAFIEQNLDSILPFVIRAVVAFFNREGFFTTS